MRNSISNLLISLAIFWGVMIAPWVFIYTISGIFNAGVAVGIIEKPEDTDYFAP